MSNIISIPLCYLPNESFSSGQYPEILKAAKCIPVLKNKESNDVSTWFQGKRSTQTAKNDLLIFIYELLNIKQKSITLFFDLTRAFNTVNHKLLVHKLCEVVVRGVPMD